MDRTRLETKANSEKRCLIKEATETTRLEEEHRLTEEATKKVCLEIKVKELH